jgi:hypothetical protein
MLTMNETSSRDTRFDGLNEIDLKIKNQRGNAQEIWEELGHAASAHQRLED